MDNAKRSITLIDITQEDIDSGVQGSFNYCPIANSLRRKYPKAEIITVNIVEANVYLPEELRFHLIRKTKSKFIRIPLPTRASRFVGNFDAYGPKDKHVKPFSFEAISVETEQ